MNFKNIKSSLLTAALLSAALTFTASAANGTVTADILNVRTGPSTSSDIAGQLNWGDTVTITYEPSSDWYEIYLGGNCYYVCSDYINGGNSSSYTESYDSYEESYNEPSYSENYLGNFALTAYCGCASCCGGKSDNITASGTYATAGRTVAMGGVPFGTKLKINGNVYTVEDRGTSYGTVDIYFATHAEALAFGLQYADVYEVY